MRSLTLIARALAALTLSVLASSGAALAQPPSDPACVPLIAGTTGLLAVGDSLPSSDQLAGRPGGFGPLAPPRVAARLPDEIVFKTSRETFSRDYAFALRRGSIYVRRARAGRPVRGERWHLLKVPPCLAGRVREISADHALLIALGPERQIYSHDMPGGDLSAERWTWRWGPYFWAGAGMRMPSVRSWSTSELTSGETFSDSSGRVQHPIGVATVYLLRAGGRITYLDPWLPADQSREVCGPRRGTVPLAGLGASGSTVFAVGRRGELFTRLYDFDISGANTVFGDYSWRRGRPAGDSRWQLPAPRWARHRRPRGLITERIGILTTGNDATDRLLRVEGRGPRGRTGYWEKRIGRAARGAWRFVATGERLRGRVLRAARRARSIEPAERTYAGTVAGSPARVADFNAACSPATLRVQVAPGLRLRLRLHSSDGLRQETRRRGLDDMPREYNGAIEVPRRLYRSLPQRDPRLRAWIDRNLGRRRFTTAPLALTATRMRFLAQCWQLTRNGEPARPDVPRIPPDLGAVAGRLTELLKDGRPLALC